MMARLIAAIRRSPRALAHGVRYGYFLRFSLALWLFAPGLCVANMFNKTLTSGIVTPETWEQYLCVGFFVVSATFAALVLARIVIINGPSRWDRGYNAENDGRPRVLVTLFNNDLSQLELRAFAIAQLPTAFVFGYLIYNGICQQVDWRLICRGFVSGAILSGAFWWLANAWYYLRFTAPEQYAQLATYTLGQNAARTILYPRSWFGLNAPSIVVAEGRPTIEQATTILPRMPFDVPGRWLARQSGFGSEAGERPYIFEAHAFAFIALAMFVLLYAVVWPLTAPVPARWTAWGMIFLLILVAVAVFVVFVTAKPAAGGKLTAIKIFLSVAIVAFVIAVISLYVGPSPERFPIFATVLILMIALCYFLGGLAFFLDRYRVPVFTLILVAMVVPRMAHWDRSVYWNHGLHLGNGQEEHYLSTTSYTGAAVPIPTPAMILAQRLAAGGDQPLIIVTATGGGLHASAWTAAILAHLEEILGPQFHQRMLLMSTVSGGSVGLLTYLRELHEGTFESSAEMARERMQSAAQCSSLEGVGWGLIYYDLPKAFIPIVPYFIPPSDGVGDLDRATPLMKDRTWSLRKSYGRNLDNHYCNALWAQDTRTKSAWIDGAPKNPSVWKSLSLRQLPPVASGQAVFPAFTMNTTVLERGERFLLANYAVPDTQPNAAPNYHARSFLKTFGGADGKLADLPLVTAAQMSATFPYVSSAARVPMSIDNNVKSVHFVDGGYYDNDGTTSAIEFLRYALQPSGGEKASLQYPHSDPIAGLGKEHPLRILLIEIRNSGDLGPPTPETSGEENGGESPWNALSQVTGPLVAFWQAGHESVTGRNRALLGLLEQAFPEKLQLHRVVFADGNSLKTAGTDPLNWSLTPIQRFEVRNSVKALGVQDKEAKDWFNSWKAMWQSSHPGDGAPAAPEKLPKQHPKAAAPPGR